MFGRKAKQYKVSLLSDGFAVAEDGHIVEQLRWDDVREVVAYKQDLFTIDRVCLDLWPTDGGAVVVNEDMLGFEPFRQQMERALVGIDAEWWAKVVLPLFAENEAVIFRRIPA